MHEKITTMADDPHPPFGNETFNALCTQYCKGEASRTLREGPPGMQAPALAAGVHLGFLAGWAVRHWLGKGSITPGNARGSALDENDTLDAMMARFPALKAAIDEIIEATDDDDVTPGSWEG